MQGNPAEVIKTINAGDQSGTVSTNIWNPGGGTTTTSVAGITGFTAITFPAGLGDDPHQPFFMTFQPKKITSAVGGTMGDMSFQSVQVTKDNIAQVALPIPTGINVAYAQGWDATDVNAVQGALMSSTAFKSVAGSMKNIAGQDESVSVNQGIGMLKEAGAKAMGVVGKGAQGAFDEIVSAVSPTGDLGGSVSKLLSKIGNMGVSGNAVAGVTLGVAGKLLGPAMSTAAGFSSFNQTLAHYNGPAFRNFNFTYTLRPLEPKDQQNIVKIVNFFKIASAPSQISNGLFRIYETPYIFKIGFFSRKGELKDVNKIAHCACTNVAVSYGGDRFQTFSGTDSPVETNIALTFKEIELITRTEMEEGY